MLACETRASPIIAWRSTAYIDDQLEFNRFSSVGDTRNSLVYNTTATLTANRMDNGVQVLVSVLHITVRSDVSSTSVICVHDNGSEAMITLHLLSMLLLITSMYMVE